MDEILLSKIDKFFTQLKRQSYKKGEILIRADDNPPGVFYLKEGYVKEYAISKKGDELVINIFKPIAFFPMSWAINDTPNEYFFEAMTDLEVWRAPREETITFIKSNPDVLYNLMSRVYKGTDGILTRMTYLMSGNAYARLITELIIHAKRFGKGQNMVALDISEKDLAAQSGMTRETVSREIKILKDKGLVDINKSRLVIKELQKLEGELADGV
ncbi:MAG: Crp/Fnr family transcriptional regulator [Candidatus Levybacteria bacterium]|nr:Crp/Fnr family transcriptional regulator [Candidatus Levybacteria bacterium]